jgi:hypothetical protein
MNGVDEAKKVYEPTYYSEMRLFWLRFGFHLLKNEL